MIKKCLFPAAGFGTRFLPATKAVPKEMLPVLNKPLLQYGGEEALNAGITNMAIVTGRGKRSIEDQKLGKTSQKVFGEWILIQFQRSTWQHNLLGER